MRSVGIALIAILAAALSIQAQSPIAPGLPPAAPVAIDPGLDGHLVGWQNTMSKATNFSAKFELTRTDALFKKDRKYAGSVLCMKPNLARFSIAHATDKNDYEAFICNGKAIFHYDWAKKKITEIPLGAGQSDNLMLDFLGGMNAAAAKQRFQIAQFNPADKNYIYLDIKPTLPKDKQEFEHIRFALFSPNVPPPLIPYLPAQMYMVKPNGDAEMWKFTDQQLDVNGITTKVFQYEDPKDKNWQYERAPIGPMPTGPAVLPGGRNLPAGQGAVKP